MRVNTLMLSTVFALSPAFASAQDEAVQLGPRPAFLIDRMTDGQLRTTLEQCAAGPFERTDFSIGHRGAALLFAEQTRESYLAAKCSVPFTPFEDSYTQQKYAQQLIDEYTAAGVRPEDVFAQSSDLQDVLYWIEHEPAFGRQAVYLDDRDGRDPPLDPNDPDTFSPGMAELSAMGVRIIAPPMWMLVAESDGEIVPSAYARAARAAGLDIIAWTFERSAPLTEAGQYYYQSVDGIVDDDGDRYVMLDVLARQVGIIGIFSDWPATVTYYANCMGL